jgi:uncharacterized RDD family membrane protein YckC
MQSTLHPPDPRDGTEQQALSRRVGAFVVDQIVVFGVVAALASFALGVGGGVLGALAEVGAVQDPLQTLLGGASGTTVFAVGAALFGVATSLATLVYFTVLEGAAGRTVGKALFGLVVVGTDGSPVGYRGALVRTLLRPLDQFPALYLLGFGSMLTSERRQRIGDRLANTVVVAADTGRSTVDGASAPTPV